MLVDGDTLRSMEKGTIVTITNNIVSKVIENDPMQGLVKVENLDVAIQYEEVQHVGIQNDNTNTPATLTFYDMDTGLVTEDTHTTPENTYATPQTPPQTKQTTTKQQQPQQQQEQQQQRKRTSTTKKQRSEKKAKTILLAAPPSTSTNSQPTNQFNTSTCTSTPLITESPTQLLQFDQPSPKSPTPPNTPSPNNHCECQGYLKEILTTVRRIELRLNDMEQQMKDHKHVPHNRSSLGFDSFLNMLDQPQQQQPQQQQEQLQQQEQQQQTFHLHQQQPQQQQQEQQQTLHLQKTQQQQQQEQQQTFHHQQQPQQQQQEQQQTLHLHQQPQQQQQEQQQTLHLHQQPQPQQQQPQQQQQQPQQQQQAIQEVVVNQHRQQHEQQQQQVQAEYEQQLHDIEQEINQQQQQQVQAQHYQPQEQQAALNPLDVDLQKFRFLAKASRSRENFAWHAVHELFTFDELQGRNCRGWAKPGLEVRKLMKVQDLLFIFFPLKPTESVAEAWSKCVGRVDSYLRKPPYDLSKKNKQK